MKFQVLNKKHKKIFIINQLIVLTALVVSLFIAWQINDVALPTSADKLSASAGIVTGGGILFLAMMNRISFLFKVRSFGFGVFWLVFLTINSVLGVLMWATGLMFLVLLVDDIIMKPYWSKVWWNEYQDVAMRMRDDK